ncbi:MAG: lysylphosphatidylglycerol synthase transmembrane domain-containing protein [Bacteroidales bacterium]
MPHRITKAIRILIFLAIGALFLVIAFRGISAEGLVQGLRSASYKWIMISLLFASLAFVSRTYRWILLIEPMGYRPGVKNTFYAIMTGYLANFVLPRLGEITRCGTLNRTDRIPVDSLLGTVIIERISDLLVLFLLATAVIFIKIELFGNFLYIYIFMPLYQMMMSWLDFPWFFHIMIVSAILIILIFYRIITIWLRKYSVWRRIERVAQRILEGMRSVAGMKKTLQFLLHTIFIWLMYFLMTWAVFMSLPSTAELGAADVLFILVIGGLGMAVPVQGGIGAYHWIVSAGLGIYGISKEEGLVFATLSHESQAILMIILGTFSMLMVFIKMKKAKQPVYKLSNSPGK